MSESLHNRASQAVAPPTATRDLATLQVIEVAETPRGTIVAARAHGLEPRMGVRLVVMGTRDIWEIRGIAFVPPGTAAAGLWGLLVSPANHDHPLPNRATLVMPQDKDLE